MSASVSEPGNPQRLDALRQRLLACFATVFPDLPEDEIPQAAQISLAAWDSIAALTLLNVVEEEFQVQIGLEVLPELDSFERMLAYVNGHPEIPAV